MSDMSFKQAKELTERFELAELSLNKTLKQVDPATKKFEQTLVKQQQILNCQPKSDEKLNIMKMVVALNIGFIAGLIVAKYLF
jgi:hypothetical protein